MKLLLIPVITMLLIFPVFDVVAGSDNDRGTELTAKPNEAVFEVHGVVCSFCAVGLQKKLSQLPFVDQSRYKKGVHVAIKDQRVTVAVRPNSEVDVQSAYSAIKSGGYEANKAVAADATGALTLYDKDGKICTTCD